MPANIVRIADYNDERIDIYTRLTENQLANIYAPNPGLFIAESPKVIMRALLDGYEPISFLTEDEQLHGRAKEAVERCGDVTVYIAEPGVLSQLHGFQMTRGVLCAMRRKELPKVEDICRDCRRIAVLEDVVNPTNVGAILRSAAALNMDAVLLTPACADPLYRRAARVSMGTAFQVPWTYIHDDYAKLQSLRDDNCVINDTCTQTAEITNDNTCTQTAPEASKSVSQKHIDRPEHHNYVEGLQQMGFKTVAMALLPDSLTPDAKVLHEEPKLAIILGAEGDGLSEDTIRMSDYTVCIPMTHGVDSLNVAAASAVAFWELSK